MAGVFASMAVKWALDKLASFLPAVAPSSSMTVTTESEDVELLRKLERTMHRIHATLHDAEEHWDIREKSAKLRLKELKELAYAAEDVVQEYENEVDRRELEAAAASVSNSKRKRKKENKTYSKDAGMVAVPVVLVVQARKIIERIDEIKEYHDNFSLSENDGDKMFTPDISTLRKTSSIVYEKSIIGREEDKNKIVEKMMSIEGNSAACPIHVLAIVGMGGLGKTTLAQLVYNDPMVRQCFDVFAWVCVSEQFDVRTITKKIIGSVTKTSCDLSELADLQEKLVAEMQEKRVLLVLDDVWNERSYLWESLCAPISRTKICNIIVTTRNEAVATMVQTMPSYHIDCMNPEHSWSLFKQVAFAAHQDNNIPANLLQIGDHIVDKCKGLPLAIKTLGSILRCETDEVRWRDVLESNLWDLKETRSGVLPALELSYKHLPIYLKRCFVALSLFPKDFALKESDVVKVWKSLDLLQCDRNGNEDDIGRIYLNQLFQGSLLEVFVEEAVVYKEVYAMHDLIHDLACFLAEEEFLRIDEDMSIEIPLTVRYISTRDNGAFIKDLTASHSIRSLIIIDGSLKEGLPLNCKKLRAITYIQLFSNGVLLPCRIGCGINIHTLPAMAINGCGCFCKISELGSLNKIRELSLSGLCFVADIEDAKEAQLWRKKNLQSLELSFISDLVDDYGIHHCENILQGEATKVSHKLLLESLRPHHVLRKLEIAFYESQRYPSWLGNASYSNLTEVLLFWFDSQHIPTLGELPSLKSLQMHSMNKVEHIGREFCSRIRGFKGFPSLTFLQLRNFIQLSEWSEVDVGEFPCLQTLLIDSALELRSLPPVPFMSLVTLHLKESGQLATVPASATLRVLNISDCPKLSAMGSFPSLTTLNIIDPEFEDEDVLDRLLNCHPSLESISVTCDTTTWITLEPQSLPSLTKLHLNCPNLQYCDGLAGLTSLQDLDVSGCPDLPA